MLLPLGVTEERIQLLNSEMGAHGALVLWKPAIARGTPNLSWSGTRVSFAQHRNRAADFCTYPHVKRIETFARADMVRSYQVSLG